MSDVYTVVDTPEGTYACHGKVSRETAIAEARSSFEYQAASAREFLSKADEEISVRVVRGLHRQKLIEELKP